MLLLVESEGDFVMDGSEHNPQSDGVILADTSELGTQSYVDLNDRLKRYARAHHRALRMSEYAKTLGESKLSHALECCGDWLLFRDYFTVNQVKLQSAVFCKKPLLCPLCAIRRAAKYLVVYQEKLSSVLASFPDLQAYMVTLTVVDGPDLLERFKLLRVSIRRMVTARLRYLGNHRRYSPIEFAKAFGGVYSIEVKRGKNSGSWHPHVHMVWFCKESPCKYNLSEEWLGFSGDSFIVDVRKFYGEMDVLAGFSEVFKYALKFSTLSLEDNWQAFSDLRGRRLIDSFGVLRGVKVPESLLDELLPEEIPYIKRLFLWYQEFGQSRYEEL